MILSFQMKFKYLALLILFILNMSATVIADSAYSPCGDAEICHSETESELQKADAQQTEKHSCGDSHCCHAGHIHHLFITDLAITFSVNSSLYYFPEYHSSPSDIYSDVIKPPTV